MENYFKEANVTCRREHALEELGQYFDGTRTFEALQSALNDSVELMNTEYYAMRLMVEAKHMGEHSWPEELLAVTLSEEDSSLSSDAKQWRAQRLVCGDSYQTMRTKITSEVTECMDSLLQQTRNQQSRAVDMYVKLEDRHPSSGRSDVRYVRHGAQTGRCADPEMQREHPQRGDLPGRRCGRITGAGRDIQQSI